MWIDTWQDMILSNVFCVSCSTPSDLEHLMPPRSEECLQRVETAGTCNESCKAPVLSNINIIARKNWLKNRGSTKDFVCLLIRCDIHQAVRLRICCTTLGRSGGQLGRSFFWWLQQACTKGPAGNMCWRFEIISLMSACDFYGDVVGSSILAHILLELPTVSYCILCLHASWPFANHVFVGWNCYEFFVHHRSSMIIIISLYMTILYHINEWKC